LVSGNTRSSIICQHIARCTNAALWRSQLPATPKMPPELRKVRRPRRQYSLSNFVYINEREKRWLRPTTCAKRPAAFACLRTGVKA
jgi:hypothetical protein